MPSRTTISGGPSVAADQIGDGHLARGCHVGDDALMERVSAQPIELRLVDARDLHLPAPGERQRFLHARVGPIGDAQPRHAAGFEGLEHGMQAVDDHGCVRCD